jgi:predicted membrane protein
METDNSQNTEYTADIFKRHRAGKIMGGLIIVAVGVLLLLKQMGTIIFPFWVLTWPMFLLVLGIFIGARHSFYGGGWLAIMLVGGVFLAQEIYPDISISEYTWPIIIIAVGVFMIVRPRNRWKYHYRWKDKWESQYYQHRYGNVPPAGPATSEDYIDSVSVFGGVHKTIMSKNFKGGDVVNIFGGAEINLSQADINGKVKLEVVQIFGGTKIIVPANWEVQVQGTPIFGGVEDKRPHSMTQRNPDKVLIIDGVAIFAGIDILCY